MIEGAVGGRRKQPWRGGKLSDMIADSLQRRILRGELAPGARLPTVEELAEQFHVSQTAVRDALGVLGSRGLITVQKRHGTRIADPDDRAYSESLAVLLMRSDFQIGELLDTREALEAALMPLAVERAHADDWTALDEALSEFEAAVASADWEHAQLAHLAFHTGLIRACDLPVLDVLFKPLGEIVSASSVPPVGGHPELWDVPLHRPILDALRSGDGAAAQAAVHDHFASTHSPAYREFRRLKFRDAPRSLDFLTDRQGR